MHLCVRISLDRKSSLLKQCSIFTGLPLRSPVPGRVAELHLQKLQIQSSSALHQSQCYLGEEARLHFSRSLAAAKTFALRGLEVLLSLCLVLIEEKHCTNAFLLYVPRVTLFSAAMMPMPFAALSIVVWASCFSAPCMRRLSC